MAATLNEDKAIKIGQSQVVVLGTIRMDSSYSTGGLAVGGPGVGYSHALISGGAGGYHLDFDAAAQKLRAYRQTAATGALAEVPNATDLSAVSVPFVGFRIG